MSLEPENKDLVWNIDFSIRGSEAVAFAVKHARVFGGDGVETPEALRSNGQKKFNEALEAITYSAVKKGSLDQEVLCLKQSELKLTGFVADIADEEELVKIQGILGDDLPTAVISFLATKGTFTESRYWLLASDKTFSHDEEECLLYVSFPKLVLGGNKSALAIGYAEDIGKFIGSGGDTAILNYFKRVGIKVKPTLRKYAFPKGMHVKGFPIKDVADFKADVDLAMKRMISVGTKTSLTDDQKNDFKFFPI